MDFARLSSEFWADHVDGANGVAIEIGVSISRLAMRQMQWQTEKLRAFKSAGITGPSDFQHLSMLHRLGGENGLGMVEQAELLGAGHAATSKRLARFEQVRLVVRTDHPTDRRSHLWSLSEHGRVTTEEAFEAIHGGFERAIARLTPDQRATTVETLRLLLESAGH